MMLGVILFALIVTYTAQPYKLRENHVLEGVLQVIQIGHLAVGYMTYKSQMDATGASALQLTLLGLSLMISGLALLRKWRFIFKMGSEAETFVERWLLGFNSNTDYQVYRKMGDHKGAAAFYAFKRANDDDANDDRMGIKDLKTYHECASMGFTSKGGYFECKRMECKTKAEYDHCKRMGFDNVNDYREFTSMGFENKFEYEECKRMDCRNKAEYEIMKKCMAMGFD